MRSTQWRPRSATPRLRQNAKIKVAKNINKIDDKNSRYYAPFKPAIQCPVETQANKEVHRFLSKSKASMHSDPLGRKNDDCCRLIGENLDGAAAWKKKIPRLHKSAT